MKTFLTAAAIGVVLGGTVLATPAYADERTCRGSLGAITVDNLLVPEGATCNLNGTYVKGSITVQNRATLTATKVRVVGNVQAEGHTRVVVSGSTVGGSIQLTQGGAADPRPAAATWWEATRRTSAKGSEARGLQKGLTRRSVSTTLENEAITTVENEATPTDWLGDLDGGLGTDPEAGGRRCPAAAGGAGPGHRQGDGGAGGGRAAATEVRTTGGADGVRAVRATGEGAASRASGPAGDGARGAGRLDGVDHVVPGQRAPVAA